MRARTISAFLVALPLAIWGAQADPLPSQSGAPAPSSASSPSQPTVTLGAPAQPDHGPGSGMYNIGYNEGCATSNLRFARQSGLKPGRDPKYYDSDQDYHDGWNKGYRKCEDKVEQGGLPVMGNSVIQ